MVDQKITSRVVHICLSCWHKEVVEISRDEYSEVKACPKCCEGVFVDVFKAVSYLLEKEDKKKNCSHKETPLLQIELADINSVPIVRYKGEEITQRIRVSLDWKTDDDQGNYPTYIHIEHHDHESQGIDTKVIQHNHPRDEDDE